VHFVRLGGLRQGMVLGMRVSAGGRAVDARSRGWNGR